jgi:hypothetical protein
VNLLIWVLLVWRLGVESPDGEGFQTLSQCQRMRLWYMRQSRVVEGVSECIRVPGTPVGEHAEPIPLDRFHWDESDIES